MLCSEKLPLESREPGARQAAAISGVTSFGTEPQASETEGVRDPNPGRGIVALLILAWGNAAVTMVLCGFVTGQESHLMYLVVPLSCSN